MRRKTRRLLADAMRDIAAFLVDRAERMIANDMLTVSGGQKGE